MNAVPLKPISSEPEPVVNATQRRHDPPPVWVQRLLLVIEVLVAVWAGMLVAVVPWTRLWSENSLVAGMPQLKAFLSLNFVRGMVSGVGLVDIWIGIWDAVQYRDQRKENDPGGPRPA